VRRGVVFCEDAGVVVGCEEEDSVHAEQGHVRRHGCGLVCVLDYSICDFLPAVQICM
jgi:hypothetical protein